MLAVLLPGELGVQMTNRIRFLHKELDSGQHSITSPDLKGFCIVAATETEAVKQAIDMLEVIRSRRGNANHERVVAVEFEAA